VSAPPVATIDRGAGPLLLLLHGQPGSGASWDPVTDLLVDEFRVVAPDRSGYGTTGSEAQGLVGNAEMAAALLDQLDAGPAVVVAHSWAGGAAVLLADQRPDLVRSLVLVGAACTPDSLDAFDRLLGLPAIGDVLAVGGLLALGEVLPRIRKLSNRVPVRYRDRFCAALPDQGVLGGERGSLGRHRRTFLTEQRALINEMPLVVGALARIRVPTVVVVGAWDLVVGHEAGRTLVRAVAGAELVEVERSGHFVARDAPGVLSGLIRAKGRDDSVSQ